jgi:hypothetical protein
MQNVKEKWVSSGYTNTKKLRSAMQEYQDYRIKLKKANADELKINLVWWSREICGINKFVVMTGHSKEFLTNKLKTEIVL